MSAEEPSTPSDPDRADDDPFESDPLERLERNEKQGPRAIRYVFASVTAIVGLGFLIVALFDVTAAECPETGPLCFTALRIEVVVLPTLLGLILSLVAAWRTYSTWKRHIRWRPWLFATYAMWIVTTAYLLVSSSAVFTQVG